MATSMPAGGAAGASDIGSASSGEEFDAGTGSGGGEVAADPAFDAGGEAEPGGVRPGEPAPAVSRFKFGRREWPSQERAEQEFLNTVGRLQAAQRRMAEVEADRDALREAMKRGGGGEGAAGASGGQEAKVAEAIDKLLDPDSLDWELITGAMKERGPEVGMYLFAQKLSEALGKGFDARLGKVMEPFKGMHEGSQRAMRASQLWDGAVTAVDEGGQMYFPELSDPQNLQTAMAIWREITDGMPEEVAMHPRMARMAILEMRAMQAGEGGAAASDGSGSAGAGPRVDPNEVASGVARAAVARARGRGVLPPGRGRQPGAPPAQPETEEQRIKRSLMSSGQESGQLGFRR